MALSKRVAILTGGGDVPGLNMCLKSLVYRVIDEGFEPIGVRKGWEGLINYNPSDPTTYGQHFMELNKRMVRPIDRTPGSFLHSSRIDPLNLPQPKVPQFLRKKNSDIRDMTGHIKDVIQRLELTALITVGDDDMLRYAAHLSREGVPLIAIPKTVHNNIYGTDYTIGFSTGLARGVAFIHELRALAGSREQVIVVETFGVDSGLSSLMTAFLAGADRAIIPEVPYDPERLAHLVLRDKGQNPSNYAVVTVSDGTALEREQAEKYASFLAHYGDKRVTHSGRITAELLQHITGQEVFMQPLTYLLRTGFPDGQDLLGATNFAILAARLLR
ncbi:MAG: 6-phosphofructokinase, partial [Anaerolineae bacterium]|nr:6-phosphofructokinase [Anaerolineae bacterium]